MRKLIILSVAFFVGVSCRSSKVPLIIPQPSIENFQNSINEEGLRTDLSFLASDSLQGRGLGTAGLDIAADFIADRYTILGLEPAGVDGSFFQPFESPEGNTKNVLAFLEGTDETLKDEVIVLSAHYDHLGIGEPDSTGDTIYNGADDDGSGTVALLHIAQALISAKKAGAEMKRSVVFLHASAEEKGKLGSEFYTQNPSFSLENTIANLNVDMIGRRDAENVGNPNYVYIIGGKIISTDLQHLLEEANELSSTLTLSDRYNSLEDPDQFYRRSDHWSFGQFGIPFIFFFSGTHADYHQPSDEVERIDFPALRNRTKLVFMTTALLANSETRPPVDGEAFIELQTVQ